MAANYEIHKFNKAHALCDQDAQLVMRMRRNGLDDEAIVGALKAIEETCNRCWDEKTGCRCWNED